MFFPERIKSIHQHDRVLEVGPGGTPHPRSNVLLEHKFTADEAAAQRGNTPPISTQAEIVFYDGKRFPFADNAFDYVICSHVLEHVHDVPAFIAELCRVAPCGYLEFPTIYYEYLYNFHVHQVYLNYQEGEIRWMKKTHSGLSKFLPVQRFFYNTLCAGYYDMVDALRDHFIQGFEWQECVAAREVTEIMELCPTADAVALPPKPLQPPPLSSAELLKEILRRLRQRVFR
jgi:SAM-dependent methyltransferase